MSLALPTFNYGWDTLAKMQARYSECKIVKALPTTFEEIAATWKQRLPAS
jgi:hypothetical protein